MFETDKNHDTDAGIEDLTGAIKTYSQCLAGLPNTEMAAL